MSLIIVSHIDIYIITPVQSIYYYLHVCFCDWPFGIGIGVLFPEEDFFFYSQHPSVACSSLSRFEALWAFPQSTLECLLLSLFYSCLGSHMDETLCVYLITFLRDKKKLSDLLALTVFLPPSLQWSQSLKNGRSCIDVFIGTGLWFWWVVAFLMAFDCWKQKMNWCGLRTTLLCGHKDNHLECSQWLCWLSKVAVVGYPPGATTSLALGSWLGFWS